jgi:hypothetical protein
MARAALAGAAAKRMPQAACFQASRAFSSGFQGEMPYLLYLMADIIIMSGK